MRRLFQRMLVRVAEVTLLLCMILSLSSATGGCARTLPRLRAAQFEQRLAPIPADAVPIFSWRGAREDLKTFWGDQALAVRVCAHIPLEGMPKEGYWLARGRNHEGKPIPFLGIIRKYRGESGSELAEVVPPLDLNRIPDGLYLTVLPNIQRENGRLVAARPIAFLHEIRNHMWKPFCVKIPLQPEQDSPLTPPPSPEEMPPARQGTPVPLE